METYSYGSAIHIEQIKEIITMLKSGMAVEFNCGLNSIGKGDYTNPKYIKHVDYWMDKIKDKMMAMDGTIFPFAYDYKSPYSTTDIRIVPSINNPKNRKFSNLLSKEY